MLFVLHVQSLKASMTRGWRCLDCTLCEGCGRAGDETRLLLCDECDIAYHIYCLEPPLADVPKGQWRCKWCVCPHVPAAFTIHIPIRSQYS